MLNRDPQYVVTLLAFQVPQAGDEVPAELASALDKNATATHLYQLAGGILAYLKTSLLIVQSSFPRDQPVAVLNGLLQAADQKAREHAHAALTAAGAVPIAALRSYQEAAALQRGSDVDRLQALESYWRSSVYSSVAALMARHAVRPL